MANRHSEGRAAHTHCLACGRCLQGGIFCSLHCMLDEVATTFLHAILTGKRDENGFVELPDFEELWEERTMKADEFDRLQTLRREVQEPRRERRIARALEARHEMLSRLAMRSAKRNPKLN